MSDESDRHLSLVACLLSYYSTHPFSCGKDNRTVLWDLFTLRPIAEVPTDILTPSHDSISGGQDGMFGAGGLASSQQRRYDIQWSPLKRGVASTCSLWIVKFRHIPSLACRLNRAVHPSGSVPVVACPVDLVDRFYRAVPRIK